MHSRKFINGLKIAIRSVIKNLHQTLCDGNLIGKCIVEEIPKVYQEKHM